MDNLIRTTVFWVVSLIVLFLMHVPFFGIEPIAIGNLKISWHFLVFALQVGYFFASIERQEQNEIGGKLFFGRVIQETRPGPVIAWAGIIEHKPKDASARNTEFPTDRVQWELITEAEAQRLRTGPESGEGIDHYRMTHNFAPVVQDDDPLNKGRLTTKVQWVLSGWKITDIVAFLTNAVDEKQFLIQMDDTGTRLFRQKFKSRTAAEMLRDWETIQEEVTVALKTLIGSFDFGVSIQGADLKGADLTREINESFSGQISARIKVETQRHAGEAEKIFKELVALGVRAEQKEILLGRAEGYQEIATRLGLPQEEVKLILGIEGMREALTRANYTLLDTGGSALGFIGAIQQVLDTTRGQSSTSAPAAPPSPPTTGTPAPAGNPPTP